MGIALINKELKDSNINNCFKNDLSIPLIFNQIFQFLDKDNIKWLTLCNKKIYQLYCNLIKKIKIDKKADILNIKVLRNKYKNFNNLDLRNYQKIKDFTSISKLERLEVLDVANTSISTISFLKKK